MASLKTSIGTGVRLRYYVHWKDEKSGHGRRRIFKNIDDAAHLFWQKQNVELDCRTASWTGIDHSWTFRKLILFYLGCQAGKLEKNIIRLSSYTKCRHDLLAVDGPILEKNILHISHRDIVDSVRTGCHRWIRSAFFLLVEKRLITFNPVDRPARRKRRPITIPPSSSVRELLNNAPVRERIACWLGICGLRIGEALAVTYNDVSADWIDNFAGLDAVFDANSLATRTTGQAAGVATLTVKTAPVVDYMTVKDTYQFTVPLTGATPSVNGFLKKGDQLVFSATAWVNQMNKQPIIGNSGDIIAFTCTAMADANSDANGDVTVTCSGVPIYDSSLPQYNTVAQAVAAGDAVMVRGVNGKLVKPSLFYTDSFMGLATIKLPKLHSIDSSVVSWNGLSIRAHKWSDGTKNGQFMRFDLLPAFACFNPMEGGQLNGGTAA